jgi:streptogramin lyase
MRSGSLATSLWLACVWIHAGAQQYTFQRSIGRAPQVDDPTALAVDKQGSVYVADRVHGHIAIVVPGKKLGLRALKTALRLEQHTAVAVAPNDNVIVAEETTGKIHILAPGGALQKSFGSVETPGGTGTVSGLAIGPNGDLYVSSRTLVISSASNARIQVFSAASPQSHHHPTQPGNSSLPVSPGAA